eukprot:scaffold43262_cov176-Amphora_coffeaeformis.AAC.1
MMIQSSILLLLLSLCGHVSHGFLSPTTTTRVVGCLQATRDRKESPVFDADQAEAMQARLQSYQRRPITTTNDGSNSQQQQSSTTNHNDPEWSFFDESRIHVSGGDGGNGCVAFRREKGEARGGPNGGSGGRGGSVYLVCDETLNTLMPLKQKVHWRATKGNNGLGKGKHGCGGDDVYVRVPPGTVVRDLKTQKLAGELRHPGQQLLVARGGRGGRGNAAFLTARRTAPKIAERGEPGAARWLSIELRLVAD